MHHKLTCDLWLESKEKISDILKIVTEEIVTKFVDMKPELREKTLKKVNQDKESDKVYRYACEFLSYGLMYKCFANSIREGDGKQILHCWKFLMLIFKSARKKNYSIESP